MFRPSACSASTCLAVSMALMHLHIMLLHALTCSTAHGHAAASTPSHFSYSTPSRLSQVGQLTQLHDDARQLLIWVDAPDSGQEAGKTTLGDVISSGSSLLVPATHLVATRPIVAQDGTHVAGGTDAADTTGAPSCKAWLRNDFCTAACRLRLLEVMLLRVE